MAVIEKAGSANKSTYSLHDEDIYDGRIASVAIVGMQKQRPYQGKPKADAVVAKITIELVGTPTVRTDEEGKTEDVPTVLFYDVTVPLAGVGMGKMVGLLQATLGCDETFGDTEDYGQLVGQPILVDVDQWSKDGGAVKNGIKGISKMPKRMMQGLPELTAPSFFFCCYTDSDEYKTKFANLPRYIQDSIAKASDAAMLPAVMNSWPTEAPAEAGSEDAGDNQDEF